MPMTTYHRRNLRKIPALQGWPEERLEEMELVARVLPFKVNDYVVNELIDWSDPESDPMYQLTFPQRGMLEERHLAKLRDAPEDERDRIARLIQLELNPHPSGQAMNVPTTDAGELEGIQHKYPTTTLFFPSQGQTCHAYCTYCFRWPQFVNLEELKFRNKDIDVLLDYLRTNPQVTDVLFTGGDPMVMRTPVLERYLRPLLEPEFEHINIRIGSKALAYWPHRFVDDPDADDLLRLFEEVRAAGRVLAFQAHYSAEVELSTDVAERAIRRVQDTGAVIRTQAPIINHVNASADAWEGMLRRQLGLNMIPYYMFVERDTGARNYFEIPIAQALEIYREATRRLTGLAHTLRGPVMSATPGKVHVNDVVDIGGRKLFVLKMLQARDVADSHRIFFADYDPDAAWFDDLHLVDLSGGPAEDAGAPVSIAS